MNNKIKRIGWVLLGVVIIWFIAASGTDTITWLIVLALIVIGCRFIFRGITGKSGKATANFASKNEELPNLSHERESHYASTGMSKHEIDFFRETMNTGKNQIQHLQDNVAQNAKLKAIDLRHDTVKASKALFKELVKNPKRLNEANHFLYTHLPNIVDLTDKYLEITEHEVKSKETFAKLEECAQIIDQMADLITKDYQAFVSDDLDDLDVEMTIAKQSLKRDNN